LASIAAVAQVEMKTRKAENETGTYIEIENSFVLKQEPCACAIGTNISMKNLFFNVPARRNFLKTNSAELRHIVDEFIRVAMAFPQIFFSFISNGQQVFYLEAGSYKQRIIQILGNQYNTKVVNVKEETDYMNVYGFVGKPDAARKTRGDQYFFVNNRYIKSAYLNHAVVSTFQDVIARDSFPLYVLFIDLDPSQIDINVHPTKQEIKFEDEKIVYAFVQAAVKHSLAQFSIAPSLDFTLNAEIQQLDAINKPFTTNSQLSAASSDLYKTFIKKNQAHLIEPNEKSDLKHWKEFFTGTHSSAISNELEQLTEDRLHITDFSASSQPLTTNYQPLINLQANAVFLQLHKTFIVAPTNAGFILLHQQLAHERILYERFIVTANGKHTFIQQSMFPVTLELAAADSVLLEDLLPELHTIGYQIEPFGKDSFVIQGTPADVFAGNEKQTIELLIEQFKHFSSDIKFTKREKLIRCMARQQAVKEGQSLSQKEMQTLAEDLFNCNTPNVTPSGNPTYLEFKEEYLNRMFGR
jgi:DNA mismatch repair protein MutL